MVSISWETPDPPHPGMPSPDTALWRGGEFQGANPQVWSNVDISKSQPGPHNPLFEVLVENSSSNNNNNIDDDDDEDDDGRRGEKDQYKSSGALRTFPAWPAFLPHTFLLSSSPFAGVLGSWSQLLYPLQVPGESL